MNPAVVKIYTKETWVISSARLLQEAMVEVLKKKSSCNVMLTGGTSAKDLYISWAMLPQFHKMENVNFYLGDERCVSLNDPESNFGMIMSTLFHGGVPNNCQVFPMYVEQFSAQDSANLYAEILPNRIDILLLSMGDDGHIASLFSGNPALNDTRLVVPVYGPKPPYQRITITPKVFTKTESIFVLAIGNQKHDIFTKLVAFDGDETPPPAALVLNATWILALNQ